MTWIVTTKCLCQQIELLYHVSNYQLITASLVIKTPQRLQAQMEFVGLSYRLAL
jgi:hypothetical protein